MTDQSNEEIQSILNHLNDWKGEQLSIEKKERDDLDKNTLSLEEVEVVHQMDDTDDYVDPYTIQLRGKGTVVHTNGKAKLPLNSYELPIKQLLSFETSKEFMTIKTDRATYFIKK
ncbi:hypothetical protein [Alkalihalobacillus sp. BA299]|uniref:hypothetical protein n=1 Tax=Alkalihalobacillus sp. BA299 TaxID=2815938 RepID=UPI001ADB7F75|nr:hypothetical protein [Alkalihalobacillus sp. BA299]